MNIIPKFIHQRITHRPHLAKILSNIGWLFIDKILRMGLGLLVGVWIARYLGPEQFGLLNFASAFIYLLSAIAGLGLADIVVRDIVRDPKNARLTLGTAAVLQILGGLLSYLLILLVISYVRPDDPKARTIVAILGATTLFKASEIAVCWFGSQVQSKYTVWVQNGAFLVFAAIKIILILGHAPFISFAWAILAEAGLAAIILLLVMNRLGQPLARLKATIERARTLLNDSWPLILSAIAISVYMKIDEIMLGQMIGNESVGIYSAAVKISEVWYFIPMSIVASVFPSILEAKKQSEEMYLARLQKLYNLMTLISLAIAIPMTFLATPIVVLLFGDAYYDSGSVLSLHIWSSVFVFMGVASGKWFLAEGLQRLALQRSLLGAITNVGLNLLLVPTYDAKGAAIATLLSYAVASYLSDLAQPQTREMFFMKTKSLYALAFNKNT